MTSILKEILITNDFRMYFVLPINYENGKIRELHQYLLRKHHN